VGRGRAIGGEARGYWLGGGGAWRRGIRGALVGRGWRRARDGIGGSHGVRGFTAEEKLSGGMLCGEVDG
jgi:hypothetical protein